MKKKLKGFTIVELIITLAILGILMSIAVPSISYYTRRLTQTEDSATAINLYKKVSSMAIDSKNKDLTSVFSESANQNTFSSLNLDYSSLYFMYSTDTNSFDTSSIPEEKNSFWIVVLPIINSTSKNYDITQPIIIYDPELDNKYINGIPSN